ncbi:MAG: hypothetical protein ACFFCQ_14490 [Promethearchaeota archaeon]
MIPKSILERLTVVNSSVDQQERVKNHLERWQGRLTIGFGVFVDLIAIPLTIILGLTDEQQYPLEIIKFVQSIILVFLFSAGAFYLITTLILIDEKQFNENQDSIKGKGEDKK